MSLRITSLKHTNQEGSAVLSFLKIQKAFSKVSSPVSARETELPWDENQNPDMTKKLIKSWKEEVRTERWREVVTEILKNVCSGLCCSTCS